MKKFGTQPNKEKSPVLEKEQSILNDWDKKILFEGGKNLVGKILEKFEGKLPEAVIFPETSARPLFYLFDPVFTKISEKMKITKPKIFFFKVKKISGFLFNAGDRNNENVFLEQVKKEVLSNSHMTERGKEKEIKNIEQVQNKRETEQKRALEIKKYAKKFDVKNFIAIDEYSDEGTTSQEIDQSFGYKIPYFCVFGEDISHLNYVPKENKGFIINNEYPKNPTTGLRGKLSYTKSLEVGKGSYKSIGVDKNEGLDNSSSFPRVFGGVKNKYSEVNKNITPQERKMMETLRKQMKELGEQIAKEY